MSMLGSGLLILAGLAIMGYGIFLFYAWLPLFYALLGLELGLILGRWLTGDIGLVAITLGVACAVVLFGAAYYLEPYRRILLGLTAGAAIGLSIATVLGLDQFVGGSLGAALAVLGAVVGGIIVPKYFDAFVILASALGGSAMVLAGAHLLFPNVGLFDRSSGGYLMTLEMLVLAIIGIAWQFKNITRWVRAEPLCGHISGMSVKDHWRKLRG